MLFFDSPLNKMSEFSENMLVLNLFACFAQKNIIVKKNSNVIRITYLSNSENSVGRKEYEKTKISFFIKRLKKIRKKF